MNAVESEIRALAKKWKAAADKNTENAKLEFAKGNVTRGKCCEARASVYFRCWNELCEIALASDSELIPPTGSRRLWERAPEYDKADSDAWRHFWTGSLEWWKPGTSRDPRDNPPLYSASAKVRRGDLTENQIKE